MNEIPHSILPAPAEGPLPPLTLEIALDAAAAETLFRAGPLAARRAGRARGSALTLTWLDTAEGALAEAGLALEQTRRGQRRLLRILPPAEEPWHPAMPAEQLAELGPIDVPDAVGDAALIPIAAFEGRRSVQPLDGGVEAVLLLGRLRAVVAEVPAARLTLSGPRDQVLETVRALGAALPALPPRAALAEEARALARGETPRPRRLGAPVLDPDLTVEQALLHALGHLAEVLLWHAPTAHDGTAVEGVHQMRVALRRLRSMLRAFRPACDGPSLRRFDGELKALATVLGPARDWDVWLGGLGAEIADALPGDARIAALLRAARQKREAAYAALRQVLDGPTFRRLAWEAVALAETRPWHAEGDEEAAERRDRPLPDFAAGVIEKRWRRLVEPGADIGELPDDEFHALRLESKRVRYVAELFAPLWARKRGKRFLIRLAKVQDAFGLANDAAVARALVASLLRRGDTGNAWAVGVAEGWALARARRARQKALAAWEELLAAETFWTQG